MIYDEGEHSPNGPVIPAARTAMGSGLRVRRIVTHSQQDQIRFLRRMVDQWKSNQLVRDKALDIVFREAGCPPKDRRCQALAIGRWVQRSITYVNDGGEQFQTPTRVLTHRYGDCDDFTVVTAALCESIGIRCQLVGLAWKGQFRHIFPRAVIPGPGGRVDLLPLDATLDQPVDRLTDPVAIARARGDKPTTFAL